MVFDDQFSEPAASFTPVETLCDMVQRKATIQELSPLIREPKFLCAECARASNNPARLCEARPLTA